MMIVMKLKKKKLSKNLVIKKSNNYTIIQYLILHQYLIYMI